MTATDDAADAHELLDALREETVRLRDPAELQFVGGDAAADEQAALALQAQLADVPTSRAALLGALHAAEVEPVVDSYASAVTDALERVRARDAPPLPEPSQAAPRPSEPTSPDRAAPNRAPPGPASTGAGSASASARAGDLAPPARRHSLVIVAVLLALAVVVGLLVLLL